MAKNSQVNIRFDDGTASDLEATAKTLGISVSALVRHLTRSYLDEVKTTGSIKLKPQWTKILGAADARSGWGDRKLPDPQTKDRDAGDRSGMTFVSAKVSKPPAKKKTGG